MDCFTKVENKILERILTADFSKRQLKILFLTIRFSFGCQKNYALLKNKDFAYAKVSPFCIKYELQKLVGKGVIKWNPNKAIVWINKNLNEWQVDNLVDNPEIFAKMITKNLPKQQLRIYQNSKFEFNKTATSFSGKPGPDKEKQHPKENVKESINKNKENIFKNYFLKISPLTEKESLILKDLLKSYNLNAIEKAIMTVSSGNERSFSYFLKILDDLAIKNRGKTIKLKGLESLESILKRLKNSRKI